MGIMYPSVLITIFTIFTNLRCLKFNPCSSFCDAVPFQLIPRDVVCSTLLELHVSVADIKDCPYIFDGRFNQLRILYVTVCGDLPRVYNMKHKVGYFY